MQQVKQKSFLQTTLENTSWKEIYDEHYGNLEVDVEPEIYTKIEDSKKKYVFDNKVYTSLGEIETDTGLPPILIKEWFKQHKYKSIKLCGDSKS